jgi:hypothetical protein
VKRNARCSCGYLALTLEGESSLNALCHCDDCRRRTGSAFGWNTYWPEGQVELPCSAATIREVPVAEPQIRNSCPKCGTMLWWTTGHAPGMIGVAGGAIEPKLEEPDASYADNQRCDWLDLPDRWMRFP